jgi:hypothetical protein
MSAMALAKSAAPTVGSRVTGMVALLSTGIDPYRSIPNSHALAKNVAQPGVPSSVSNEFACFSVILPELQSPRTIHAHRHSSEEGISGW